MHRLYRLQQRLAITTPEASALLFLAAVLLTGFAARHFQAQATPFEASYYAELQADFAARSQAPLPVSVADSTGETTQADAVAEDAVAEAAPGARASRGKEPPVRMNLNTASSRLLQRLPRVGPKTAERIIAYREAHGPFTRASHIVRVRGIGPKTFEKMEPYLFVDGESESD